MVRTRPQPGRTWASGSEPATVQVAACTGPSRSCLAVQAALRSSNAGSSTGRVQRHGMRRRTGKASPKYEVLGNAATGRDKEDAAMPRTSSAQEMPRHKRRGVELFGKRLEPNMAAPNGADDVVEVLGAKTISNAF